MRTLAGKRVLVTGAARGIGYHTALAFARRGAQLLITDRDAGALPEAAEGIRRAGGGVETFELDVTDAAVIASLAGRLADERREIDVLVNNAGTVHGGAFLEIPLAKHRQTLEINLLGTVTMTHTFLPMLIARPEANLVNIVSASAFVGLPFGSTYASSKWGALGFGESIRYEMAELGHRHVHVTSVCPSYVSTGLFDGAKAPRLTQFLEPERLGEQIVRGVERNKPFVLSPALVRTTPLLRGVLPTWLFDRAARWFGITDTMRQWRGHTGGQRRDVQAREKAGVP